MTNKLFIGSLAWAVTDEDLKEFFSQVGTVVSAKVIVDRDSQRSKGFAFVEMSTEEEANEAINKLNSKDLKGRPVVVSLAKPKE